MKDILAFTGIAVVLDILAKMPLSELASLISTLLTLILAVVLFVVKLRNALKDGKITAAEKKELEEAAQVIVLSKDQTMQLLERITKDGDKEEKSK